MVNNDLHTSFPDFLNQEQKKQEQQEQEKMKEVLRSSLLQIGLSLSCSSEEIFKTTLSALDITIQQQVGESTKSPTLGGVFIFEKYNTSHSDISIKETSFLPDANLDDVDPVITWTIQKKNDNQEC
ncbi:hypothetical protein K8R20_02405 [bacterium]|nr:hypothetical protein [bacterium]